MRHVFANSLPWLVFPTPAVTVIDGYEFVVMPVGMMAVMPAGMVITLVQQLIEQIHIIFLQSSESDAP